MSGAAGGGRAWSADDPVVRDGDPGATFCFDLPPERRDPATARASVLPVPYDRTSTYVKGADRGPAAILAASRQVELLDVESGREPTRRGVLTLRPVVVDEGPERLAGLVRAAVGRELDAERLPIVLGGEHSVSIGAIEAAAERFPGLGILQVDAHADTRESYEGSTHNHACVMARAREHGPIVQVGIRSLDASELEGLDLDRVFFAHDIVAARGTPRARDWMDAAVARLPEHVYLTIDLDGLDPSIVPCTGTPEPGGLTWDEVTGLVQRLAANRRVVAADVVELCPMPPMHASEFIAARLVHRLLAMLLD